MESQTWSSYAYLEVPYHKVYEFPCYFRYSTFTWHRKIMAPLHWLILTANHIIGHFCCCCVLGLAVWFSGELPRSYSDSYCLSVLSQCDSDFDCVPLVLSLLSGLIFAIFHLGSLLAHFHHNRCLLIGWNRWSSHWWLSCYLGRKELAGRHCWRCCLRFLYNLEQWDFHHNSSQVQYHWCWNQATRHYLHSILYRMAVELLNFEIVRNPPDTWPYQFLRCYLA